MSAVHTLTDAEHDIRLDTFHVGSAELGVATPVPWSVRKRSLRGGLRDGVDLIEVDNGALKFCIVPTRGMGLWRGSFNGMPLGWQAPVMGPVHPQFVDLAARGGLGWLTGFDEWLCRCGLAWMGPPGDDNGTTISLHGRIANTPAHRVEVAVQKQPPHAISVFGQVEEGGLFSSRLRLTTTYTTRPGSNMLTVHDVVENRSGQLAELQLLYHCNNGPPLLAEGGRVRVPVREVTSLTAWAARGVKTWDTYAGPVAGFAEQVYSCVPAAGDNGKTLAVLHDPAGERGLALRWDVWQLPYFTVWKNTAAVADGYVTGLEPATCFPRFKAKERDAGRVLALPAGGRWETTWSIEAFDTAMAVTEAVREVEQIQANAEPVIHSEPME
jgi:hypothetical protein